MMIKKGDKVVMHSCYEAKIYEGKIFEALSDEVEMCGTKCVFIDGQGAFDVNCLAKVNSE